MRLTEIVLLLVVMAVVQTSRGHAKTFTRCQLSKELIRYNFPRSFVPNWVCIIEHGSGLTTDKLTSDNNTHSYGLFQISKEWCRKGRKGGHCNTKCEDLLNEDLSDDVRCAKRVYDRLGFKAWPSSYAYCKEKKMLSEMSKC